KHLFADIFISFVDERVADGLFFFKIFAHVALDFVFNRDPLALKFAFIMVFKPERFGGIVDSEHVDWLLFGELFQFFLEVGFKAMFDVEKDEIPIIVIGDNGFIVVNKRGNIVIGFDDFRRIALI